MGYSKETNDESPNFPIKMLGTPLDIQYSNLRMVGLEILALRAYLLNKLDHQERRCVRELTVPSLYVRR
jgi:hypothetical protein